MTGLIALRNTRIQARSQREREEAARREQRRDQQIEMRRAAYAAFLDAVVDVSNSCKNMKTAHFGKAKIEQFEQMLQAPMAKAFIMNRKLTVVRLEGPPAVAIKAEACQVAALGYYMALLRIAVAAIGSRRSGTLANEVGDRCKEEARMADVAEEQFVSAAREALGRHL